KIYASDDISRKDNMQNWVGFSSIDDTKILSSNDVTKVFKQSQEKIVKIQKDVLLLFGFKSQAKRTPDLKAIVKLINAIARNWYNGARLITQEELMDIKSNTSNYHLITPILLSYKSESINKTQKLFDSIPVTTDIAIPKSSNEVCKESSYNNIVKKSVTNLSQLSSLVLTQNQLNDAEQFSNITETKKEISESLDMICSPLAISLSSEFLIKNESDINILIYYLQQKFQISQERLE
ncbi:1249_t:CDS:2, partial [Scutellospora calospora]